MIISQIDLNIQPLNCNLNHCFKRKHLANDASRLQEPSGCFTAESGTINPLLRAAASRGLTSPTCGVHAATLHQPGFTAFPTSGALKKLNQSKVFTCVWCQMREVAMNGAGVELKGEVPLAPRHFLRSVFYPHVQRPVFDGISVSVGHFNYVFLTSLRNSCGSADIEILF